MIDSLEQYALVVDQALSAAFAYYNTDEETMSDREYDALLEQIRQYEKENPTQVIEHTLFTSVAAGTSKGGDVSHAFPMLSMEKATEIEDVDSFVSVVQGEIVIEPKLDGLAISALYEDGKFVRAALRGDGNKGEEVTSQILLLKPKYFPLVVSRTDSFEVRGELIMDTEDFAFSSEQRMNWLHEKNNKRRVDLRKSEEELAVNGFKNSRNAIAGSIRRESVDYEVRATFYAYDLALEDHDGEFVSHRKRVESLKSDGFFPSVSLADEVIGDGPIVTRVQRFGEIRRAGGLGYPTDGIVLKADLDEDRDRLGATSSRPRWSLAFKYPDETAETILRDIEIAVGRTGNISFTAIYDPRKVEGSTISRATLHNFDYIQKHDLRIGGKVQIFKANGVIPRVISIPDYEHSADLVPYEPERVCPLTGEPLDTSGAIWRSTSPEASLGGLIEYACSRDVLDIEGIGSGTAVALVDAGVVNNVADLFTLTVAQVAALPLLDSKTGEYKRVEKTGELRVTGDLQARKIIAEIEKAKSQPFNRIITSLGIRKCGRTFGRRLAAEFKTAENLINARMEDLMKVEGVKEGRGEYFFAGIAANGENLRRMAELGVNMGTEENESSNEGKPLAGLKVCITGALKSEPRLAHIGRTAGNELIESYGGVASSSVSKATDILVAGEEVGTKFKKAQELGVKILNPEEFADMLGL